MIAVLMTCFNRREKTLHCLESLYRQGYDIDVFLCDDGSTDGTAEAVRRHYPEVKIYTGGNLFWNKGMLLVQKEAIKKNYEYYLMVNDDVDFYNNMIQTLMSCESSVNQRLYAVVGSTCNNQGATTYGGRCFAEKPLTYSDVIDPNGAIQKCDVANWNCFLIPRAVIQNVGLLDPIYEHGFGDYDYCYRLAEAGMPIFVAPNYVGECETNNKVNPLNNKEIPRRKKMRILFSNKGIPVKSWYVYTKRYGGRLWLRAFVSPYIKNCLKILLNAPIN